MLPHQEQADTQMVQHPEQVDIVQLEVASMM